MIARTLLIASALTLGALALPAQADSGVSIRFAVAAPPHVKVVHAAHHGHSYGHPARVDHHWKHERRHKAAHHRHHDHWQTAQRHSDHQHRHGDRDRDYGRQQDRGHGHDRDNRR